MYHSRNYAANHAKIDAYLTRNYGYVTTVALSAYPKTDVILSEYEVSNGFRIGCKPTRCQHNHLCNGDFCDRRMAYLAEFVRTGNPNCVGSDLSEWLSWRDEADAPKVLKLDADMTAAHIGMDREELSMQGIRADLLTEAAPIRDFVKIVLSAIQPYWTALDDGGVR